MRTVKRKEVGAVALNWTWDENIPEAIRKSSNGDDMVNNFITIMVNQRVAASSPRKTYFEDPEEEEEEIVQEPVDLRPAWKIKNEQEFNKHVAEMKEWLEETGMDTHPAVGTAFEEFLRWSNPETTISINYYTKGDALRDYDDYEDFMAGY